MYLCIDLGGTKTLVAAVDNNGKVVESIKFPTPPDYDKFIELLSQTIHSLEHKDFAYACMAVPGRIDRTLGIAIAFGNRPWENVPILADMEKRIHTPMLIENDSKLAGLSEAVLLRDKFRKVLYITVSTGIGGVLVIDGKIDPDTQDSEVGHLLLEHQGKLMHWETFASGKAIFTKYGKKASDITDPSAWYVISRNIAIGLIDLIAAYTPEAVVIGGGVGTHLLKFQDRLEEELKIYESPMLKMPIVLGAQRPEEAVIYGCYEYIRQHPR